MFSSDSAVALSRTNGITPQYCGTPGCRRTGWSQATDDGEPFEVAIFMCQGCGRYSSLGRRSILARIKAQPT